MSSTSRARTRRTQFGGAVTLQWGDYWFGPVRNDTVALDSSENFEFEYIDDVRGNPDEVKPVGHGKFRIVQGSALDYAIDIYGRFQYHASGNGLRMDNFQVDANWKNLFGPINEAFVGDMVFNAMQEWKSLIPEDISIANFIYELKDLPSLIVKLQGMKTLPNGFLSYEFGWKPLISDLKTLSTIIPSVIARLQYLRAINRKWVRLYYKKDVSEHYPILGSGIGSLKYPWLTGGLTFERVNPKATFVVAAKVRYDIEGLDGDIALLKAFLVALGLTNPARIVWNAIPYSFVIDWFLKVSDRFQPAIKVYKAKMDVRHFTWSLKEQCAIRVNSIPVYQPGTSNLVVTGVGQVIGKRYTRRTNVPLGSGTLQLSSLSGQQKLLLGALISQRFLK